MLYTHHDSWRWEDEWEGWWGQWGLWIASPYFRPRGSRRQGFRHCRCHRRRGGKCPASWGECSGGLLRMSLHRRAFLLPLGTFFTHLILAREKDERGEESLFFKSIELELQIPAVVSFFLSSGRLDDRRRSTVLLLYYYSYLCLPAHTVHTLTLILFTAAHSSHILSTDRHTYTYIYTQRNTHSVTESERQCNFRPELRSKNLFSWLELGTHTHSQPTDRQKDYWARKKKKRHTHNTQKEKLFIPFL